MQPPATRLEIHLQQDLSIWLACLVKVKVYLVQESRVTFISGGVRFV